MPHSLDHLLADNRLLAMADLGGTPDRMPQTETEAEVLETQGAIDAAIDRALPGLVMRDTPASPVQDSHGRDIRDLPEAGVT